MTQYLQVFISAEDKAQANTILNSLLKKKLVSGGLVMSAPARFWWKGKIIDMEYFNISTFTVQKHKKAIINTVKKVSIEEVPMIWFTEIDANSKMLEWIDASLGS